MKTVIRFNRSYWRWGWLGPYCTWNGGLIYPWRLGLGPIQFRGTVDDRQRKKADVARFRGIRAAEESIALLDCINRAAADRLRRAVNETKKVWELS